MKLVLKPVDTSFISGKPAIRDYFDERGILLLSKGQDPRSQAKILNSRPVFNLHYEWQEPEEETTSSDCCPKDRIISKRICPYIQRIYVQVKLLEISLFVKGIRFIDRLIQDLESHPILAEDFEALRNYDNYTYMHSINVALLSYAIGTHMKYEGEKLRRLVLGALLHDIGKLSIPVSIINKPMPLCEEEFLVVQNHPTRGFQRSTDFFLPRSVLATILEHHERWDGRGYPRGLSIYDIHPYAHIVAVADVFDALVSDRPYRPGFPPYHAIEMIIKGSGTEFSPEVVQAFFHAIQIYPEDCLVTLDNGESGTVIGFSLPYPTRPVVKILYDAKGESLEYEKIIDLALDSSHFIKSVKYDWII